MSTQAEDRATGSTDAGIQDREFSVETLRDDSGLQTKPAEAIVEEFDSWAEIAAFDGDFEDITGVGPATAGTLDGLQSELNEDSEEVGEPSVNVSEDDGDDAPDAPDAPDESTEGEPENDDEGASEDSETEADDGDEGSEEDLPPEIADREVPDTFDLTAPADTLTTFVGSVNKFVDEFRLRVFDDHLRIIAVDAANVMMGDLNMSAEACDSWDVSRGVLGIDGVRFTEILNMASSGDEVMMSLDSATRKLTIHIDGLEFTMGLLDVNSIRHPPDIPEGLELQAEATIHKDELKRAVKAADMVADTTLFEMTAGGEFFISAEGDTDDVCLDIEGENLISISPPAEDVNALFALEYMKQVKSIAKDADVDEVTVRFAQDKPIKVNIELADGDGSAMLMLAPRVQSM
jgi:proliferating cell nuclear antigen